MAVKVRCPTCEKVLNAPDSARGKAVKCPGCETKVKVPAGPAEGGEDASSTKRTARTAVKKAEADSTDFLATLDLGKAEDTSEAMCPKCGASIPEDATECPACGVDPTTGQLSARAKKRKGMKGPDPALFYSLAWTDSWAFMKENYTVALRTGIYMLLGGMIMGGCGFMVGWCDTLPPKFFWLGLAIATMLAIVGWPWHLVIQTVRTTVARKSNIRDIHFDPYLCIALGIKWILWIVVFCWLPFAFLMYPLAMIHMAMPVTKRAWINFVMFSTFFKNFGATLYYWLIFLVMALIVGTINGLGYLTLALAFGAQFRDAMMGQQPPSGATTWIMLGVMLVFAVLQNLAFGFTEVFKARVIGLLAYYFKDSLDLVVLVAEKEYKRKEVKVDKWGNPIKTTGKKVAEAAIAIVVIAIVAGVGYWIYLTQIKKS